MCVRVSVGHTGEPCAKTAEPIEMTFGKHVLDKGKGKGRTLVIAPLLGLPATTEAHGAHRAASHIPALYLPD